MVTAQPSRILVVDDEKFNTLLLIRILGHSYEVDVAVNGHDALNKLSQQDYDLVLLDVMMPILNGLDTLKIIREHMDLVNLPVILVSALNDNETIANGIELGANDYITKPIDSRIVMARVKTQIDLKHLTDERETVISALEDANAMKVRMMQIASHDLRNPLNNLSLLMSILFDEIADNSVSSQNLDKLAMQSIETMDTIIQDFLSGDAFADGNLATDRKALFSSNILNSIMSQYRIASKQKNISIITDLADEVVIFADEKRLRQVLSNLISNAIKYTPRDGEVQIRSYQSNNMWRLEVQDSGPGIPESEQQYLFQAFSKNQISTTPTDGESSTGLGLWIAAEMMRVQEGSIGMDSPESGGCCFWIEMPLSEQDMLVTA